MIDFYENTNAAIVILRLVLKTRELQQEGGRRGAGGERKKKE